MKLSKIIIYPIKSFGGITLSFSQVDGFGLYMDRRWMLVDERGQFITLRQCPELIDFTCALKGSTVVVKHRKKSGFKVELIMGVCSDRKIPVTIWGEKLDVNIVSEKLDEKFSVILGKQVHLVFMQDTVLRQVDPTYAPEDTYTAFSDGFPILLIGEASLADLNSKLEQKITMERFRPNLVISSSTPFIEDEMQEIQVGDLGMRVVKPCSRCVVTTIDPETGVKGKEPLTTLAQYRLQDGKVMFGQNVLPKEQGELKVGDKLTVIS